MDKEYVKNLVDHGAAIRSEFAELWAAAGEGPITPEQARLTLDLMYKRSMLDIIEKLPHYVKHYPAKMGYRGRLAKVDSLWWVDHATAGINGMGTLGWFSNKLRSHTKKFTDKAKAEKYARRRKSKVVQKNGKFYVSWKGYSNAITHFVALLDGTPFMILPLKDGCWGEPKRNGDGIHIEMVNPMVVHRKGKDWHFWAGKLPDRIVKVQHPEHLDKPFRGVSYMLPYLWEQVITNIKIKRLCIAATMKQMKPEDVELTPRMALDRMSQHTDWRSTKFDMGPLWPFDMCNNAAFENYPVASYSFFQDFIRAGDMDPVADYDEVKALEGLAASEDEDHDTFDEDESIDSTREIQDALIKIYGPAALPRWGADGDMGKETTTAVRHFQSDWNKNSNARIKEDGIPGVVTCAKLESALELQARFRKTPF